MSEWELSVDKGALATPPGAPEMESPAWLGNLPRVLGDLGVGVVVWDDEIPIYVSPLFSDMIGYTPEELGVLPLERGADGVDLVSIYLAIHQARNVLVHHHLRVASVPSNGRNSAAIDSRARKMRDRTVPMGQFITFAISS